jgi:hypothetical protein
VKKISSYVFKKNKREIATYYLTKKDLRKKKINTDDAICLVLDAQDKRKAHSFYFRPDEVLLVAGLLTEAVRRSTKKYSLGIIK